MNLKLLLDEDVQYMLFEALQKRGYDVVHVQEDYRKGMTDQEQLEFAIQSGRCFFTYNVKDFVLLHNQYVKNKKDHWGIIVSKQLPFSIVLQRLLQKLQKVSLDSIKNRLEFL